MVKSSSLFGGASLALILFVFTSIASAQATPVAPAATPSGGAVAPLSGSYVISSNDVLRFRIIGEPETLIEAPVSADGGFFFPFLGEVRVQGLTVEGARQRLLALYRPDFYVDPQIDLVVISHSRRTFSVTGKVNRQDTYAFPPDRPVFLLEAIASAGGWSSDGLANRSAVRIIRTNERGEREVIGPINADNITPRDHPLQEGDVVEVPRRLW
ncbi:MAG: polysaccharide biosynthesis/export family protein [Verrucomicrobia bacterium]|nr:polysaccharide biosynthesis/export family protein [Verrucomicrobiota bacterium]